MRADRKERTAQIKIEVEPRLHRRVKAHAAERGKSITRYVTGVLEQQLENEAKEEKNSH